MKELKYIKLFESFESNKLNKMLNWKNVPSNDKKRFLDLIKKLATNFDMPESKFSDDLFEYLPFSRALALNNNIIGDVPCENKGDDNNVCDAGKIKKRWGGAVRTGFRNVDCPVCRGTGIKPKNPKLSMIKFWFDKDGKFIATTAVDGIYRPTSGGAQVSTFSSNIDDYEIVKRLPKTQINTLNTGDIIAVDLIEKGWNDRIYPQVVSFIQKAPTWNGDKLFALQNTRSYNNNYPRDTAGWNTIANSFWQLTASRCNNIHILKPKNNVTGQDPYGWNTDFDTSSFRTKPIQINSKIKDANFAIVLDFSKLEQKEFDKKSDIVSGRFKEREGATALLSNDDIKQANLKRYFKKLADLSLAKGELTDINGFSRMVSRGLGGRYAIFYLNYQANSSYSENLSTIASYLFKIIKSINKAEKDGTTEELKTDSNFQSSVQSVNSKFKNILETIGSDNRDIESRLDKLKNKIKSDSSELDAEKENKIVSLLLKVSNEMDQYLKSLPVETLEDVEILIQEIQTIKYSLRSERIGLSTLNNFFDRMRSTSYYSDVYSQLVQKKQYYGNIINSLNMLSSIIQRKKDMIK